MRAPHLFAVALLTTTLRCETAVAAEVPALPLPQALRPLTLPRFTLAPEIELDVSRREYAGGADDLAGMNLGARFGITRDLEVGALVLPLRFVNGQFAAPGGQPGVTYGSNRLESGNLLVHTTYRLFARPSFELGARVQARIIIGHEPGAQITASVPLRFHLGGSVRLDFGLDATVEKRRCPLPCSDHLSYDIPTRHGLAVGLSWPFALTVSTSEALHLGLRTGFNLLNVVDRKIYGALPVGFFAGYAVGGNTPILDVLIAVDFPDALLLPGFAHWNDNLAGSPGSLDVTLAVRGYLALR